MLRPGGRFRLLAVTASVKGVAELVGVVVEELVKLDVVNTMPPAHRPPPPGEFPEARGAGTLRLVGALHLVGSKTEIAGMDPATFLGLLISLVALLLSFFTPAGWVKRLLRVAAGIALLEFVLLAVSMPIWVRVVIGLVLFAGGVAWVVLAGRKDPPADATDQKHTKQIRAVLDSVDTELKKGNPSNLGETDAEIIASHFPALAKQVNEWDDAANAVATAKERLRTSVGSQLRELHLDESPYQFDSIRDGLYAITEARTADPAASTQPFPPMTGYENEKPVFTFGCSDSARFVFLVFNKAAGATGDVLRLEGSSYPGADARGYEELYGRPIYDLLNKMQAWNSTKLLIMKRQRLRDFAGDSLGRAVSKERGKTYYLRAQGCPGCNELASWGTFWPPKWDGWRTLLPGCRQDRQG